MSKIISPIQKTVAVLRKNNPTTYVTHVVYDAKTDKFDTLVFTEIGPCLVSELDDFEKYDNR